MDQGAELLGEGLIFGVAAAIVIIEYNRNQAKSTQDRENAARLEQERRQLIEERFHGMLDQFQREIEALRSLNHPGIIRLYDVYMATPNKICTKRSSNCSTTNFHNDLDLACSKTLGPY